jgi:hypothetical protein
VPAGARSWIANGAMTDGYAMLAWLLFHAHRIPAAGPGAARTAELLRAGYLGDGGADGEAAGAHGCATLGT